MAELENNNLTSLEDQQPKAPLSEAQIALVIQQTRRQWLAEYSNVQKIQEKTHKRLDLEYLNIITRMFDHEATRNSYSTVGRFVSDTVRNAVQEWVRNNSQSLPQLDETTIKNLKAHYLEVYEKTMKAELENLAKHKAQEEVENLLEKFWSQPTDATV